MKLYPDFFNDVFGPIMQPGSSSHTAAPCRLGYMANCLLGEKPVHVEVILDPQGSFAGTFGLMNEDLGMLSGAMGFLPNDIRIFEAKEIAQKNNIKYKFTIKEMKESNHINAMKFVLTGESGKVITLVGDSTGGGMVETKIVNGFPLRLKGDTYAVLLFDYNRELTESDLSKIMDILDGEIVEKGEVLAEGKGCLFYYQTPSPPNAGDIQGYLPDYQVEVIAPILPVITTKNKKKQLFDSMTRWREICSENNESLSEVAIRYEMDSSGWSREQIVEYFKMIVKKMHRQTHAVYEEDVKVLETPFSGLHHEAWAKYREKGKVMAGPVIGEALTWAWGASASLPGVEIVPGPMGTGGGYLYSALFAVKESHGFSDDDLLRAIIVAAGVGALAYTRTSPTGESIGCTGEAGICATMAAAAITEMAGGTPEQVENAASLTLQSFMGIPCDPIPGGFGQPCRSRVVSAVCMSIVFADLALSGRTAVLPLHDILDAADSVGRNLTSDLLCTSKGGCCATPSARELTAQFKKWHSTQVTTEGRI